jgi:hypothetical protein
MLLQEKKTVEDGKVITQTIYDVEPTFEQNAALRTNAPVMVGSKGQALMLAASVPMEHVLALKNMGYDLLSPDRDEMRRALVFLQSEQSKFMTTDKKVFTTRHQRWA